MPGIWVLIRPYYCHIYHLIFLLSDYGHYYYSLVVYKAFGLFFDVKNVRNLSIYKAFGFWSAQPRSIEEEKKEDKQESAPAGAYGIFQLCQGLRGMLPVRSPLDGSAVIVRCVI